MMRQPHHTLVEFVDPLFSRGNGWSIPVVSEAWCGPPGRAPAALLTKVFRKKEPGPVLPQSPGGRARTGRNESVSCTVHDNSSDSLVLCQRNSAGAEVAGASLHRHRGLMNETQRPTCMLCLSNQQIAFSSLLGDPHFSSLPSLCRRALGRPWEVMAVWVLCAPWRNEDKTEAPQPYPWAGRFIGRRRARLTPKSPFTIMSSSQIHIFYCGLHTATFSADNRGCQAPSARRLSGAN